TLCAVWLITVNAAGDICGLMFFAMSPQTLSRLKNPISPKAKSRNGTIAVRIWKERALDQTSSLRSRNEPVSSPSAAGSSVLALRRFRAFRWFFALRRLMAVAMQACTRGRYGLPARRTDLHDPRLSESRVGCPDGAGWT